MRRGPASSAYRPAPVQVNYLVYPGTTGANYMDYVLADRVVLPLDQQPFCSEKIVHLPDCYQANDATRARAAGALARRSRVAREWLCLLLLQQ